LTFGFGIIILQGVSRRKSVAGINIMNILLLGYFLLSQMAGMGLIPVSVAVSDKCTSITCQLDGMFVSVSPCSWRPWKVGM
jgi:hypothetical protein